MSFKNFFNRKSAQPSSISPAAEPTVLSPWQAQNGETIDELARFIDFAEGFTLGFLEINFEQDFDEVLKALQTHRDCFSVSFHVFNLNDPNLCFLKDELEQKIEQLPPPTSLLMEEQRVIFVKGLENAIGLFGDYPPVLQDLNFVRDAWIESVPYPVLFCLPSYAINRIIKFAPDFWSWKSGIFRILSSQEREDEASIYALHAQKTIGNASQLERQERIKLLKKLAQEFDPLQTNSSKDDLRIAAKALIELAIIYEFSGEFLESLSVLKRTKEVLDKIEWQPETRADLNTHIKYLIWQGHINYRLGNVFESEQQLKLALELNHNIDPDLKCISYFCLGMLKASQSEVADAISLYKKSLDIQNHTGNTQSKSRILHRLGMLKASQGEVAEAMLLYQQSLDIEDCTNDFRGKASTLHSISSLKVNQGEIEEALTLYQQSLEIYTSIGNLDGKASTLHSIGSLKVNQGEIEEALTLYQQSLEICESIGNLHGKASTLHSIGKLKADQGDVEEALMLYQQSLEIEESIGNLQGKAITLHAIGEIKENQGDVEEALTLYQQSLEIKENIGDLRNKATTLREIATVRAIQGDIESALDLYQNALAIFDKTDAAFSKAKTLWKYGELLAHEKGDFTRAISYLQDSLAILQRISSPDAVTVQAVLNRIQNMAAQ